MRRTCKRPRTATSSLVVAAAAIAGAAFAQGPIVTGLTPVTGRADLLAPRVSIANLDAGDLVVGNSRWDNDGDGIIFNETYVGFLWSPDAEIAVFEISDAMYNVPNRHRPAEIAADGTVVGNDLYPAQFTSLPFVYTKAAGFRLLPLPPAGPGQTNMGFATAVSADGHTIAGTIRQGIFTDVPTHAVTWTARSSAPLVRPRLRLLDTEDDFSAASDVSADGSVVVGWSGPDASGQTARRWVDGSAQGLEVVGDTSVASFTSVDGATAVGTACVGPQTVLVRWDAAGTAHVAAPPAGSTIEEIHAINPAATAVVGAVSVPDPSTPFGTNAAPFVWTPDDGFTILPELGREQDYDLSVALDVSDDGNVVVGSFGSSVIFNGDPPTLGWIWIRGSGVFVVDDLLRDAGFTFAVSEVVAIAGDASRILGTGSLVGTIHDTTSAVIGLQLP